MTKETKIKQQIKDYLRLRQIPFIWNLQGLGSYPGTPDLCVFWKSQTIWLEIKKPGGKLSKKQIEFQAMCKNAGVPYVVARSVEDLIKVLQEIK